MDPFSVFRDERGSISISRVQTVGVVAILLLGQVVSLWQTGKLAPIDPTLLGLLGLSNGTYLGAKAVVQTKEKAPSAGSPDVVSSLVDGPPNRRPARSDVGIG